MTKLPSPQRSEVSRSKTGALKVLFFWAIDGPGVRRYKEEAILRQKMGIGRQIEHKERRIERDW